MSEHTDKLATHDAEYVEEMTAAYVECALWVGQNWSDVGEGGEDNPRPWDDDYSADDVSEDAMEEIKRECAAFYRDNREHLAAGEWDAEQAGHDFFLTRNRHGAGYWDRGKGASGDALTEAAHVYGETDFYVREDGKLGIE